MIKVICFDLDGVYFTDSGKKEFHESLVTLSGSEEKVIQSLYNSPEILDFVTGKIPEKQFWDFMRNSLNIDLTDHEFRDLWVKGYKIDDDVRQAILNLKQNGYVIATCSNNNPARINALENKFGFLKDFDIKVFSYEVGAVKPNKEIFKALIEIAGIDANEIIYSDDNPNRIKGAAELGINVFVYESFEQFLKQLELLGVNLK